MAVSNQFTIDKEIDVSKNQAPEFGYIFHDLTLLGSVGTSARILSYVAQQNEVICALNVFPTTIASGTLKVDVLVDGVSVCSQVATATVADTPALPATFSSTVILSGSLVLVATTSDSSTVTDVFGQLVTRPRFGEERNRTS